MPKYRPPEVPGKYGAPMGRPNNSSYLDAEGEWQEMEVLPNARPFTLRRVAMVGDGAYDSGGAYWGIGDPLYYFEGPLSDISGYVRGKTRAEAKAEVVKIHPNARFFR